MIGQYSLVLKEKEFSFLIYVFQDRKIVRDDRE